MSHPSEYPYSVRTTKFETLVKGHDTRESAEADAKTRNERAKELRLDIRYEATVIPASRSKKE
jgi:hypothetical protein